MGLGIDSLGGVEHWEGQGLRGSTLGRARKRPRGRGGALGGAGSEGEYWR